jgi:hypothetical protein
MSLLVMGQATKSPCACWSVVGGFEKGDVSVVIDGKTGSFQTDDAVNRHRGRPGIDLNPIVIDGDRSFRRGA